MTLIEYLQSAAAELREAKVNENGRSGVRLPSSREWALADHVETMLTEHPPCDCRACTRQGQPTGCAQCRALYLECGSGSFYPCPSLRSLADLVATVTGNPIPEGARQ